MLTLIIIVNIIDKNNTPIETDNLTGTIQKIELWNFARSTGFDVFIETEQGIKRINITSCSSVIKVLNAGDFISILVDTQRLSWRDNGETNGTALKITKNNEIICDIKTSNQNA